MKENCFKECKNKEKFKDFLKINTPRNLCLMKTGSYFDLRRGLSFISVVPSKVKEEIWCP